MRERSQLTTGDSDATLADSLSAGVRILPSHLVRLPIAKCSTLLMFGAALAIATDISRAAEPELIGRWALAGDANDSSRQAHASQARDVSFEAKGRDGSSTVAIFNGRSSAIAVPNGLKLGTDDFTISLWLHTDETLDDDIGDLVTLYDAKTRTGFNLSLRSNTGVTTCQPNQRQLQFGIDAGSEPAWTDEGRPGNAIIAFALAVHNGALYAGTAANGSTDAGSVYLYNGPGQWKHLSNPDSSNAVTSLAVYMGQLFAGSSKYRFAGSALEESQNTNLGGGVFQSSGGQRWREVGRLPEAEAIGGLVVYKGALYASSLYRPAGFYRWEKDGSWKPLPVPDGKRVEAMTVFNGHLWASSYDDGRVFRFDGETWKDFGRLGENTQTYSFVVHRGQLCVGTWPSGRVYALGPDDTWEDRGRLGNELEVMGMLVHNGQLYAGSLPLAEVYRYDGNQTWTKTAQLDTTLDVKYRRAWTMAQYRGRLFCSTLPSGHIHSLTAGACVTHDRELLPGWRHVAAVKQGGRLRLFVDGQLVAESAEFDAAKFNLTTDAPLRIGTGEGDFFNGRMSDAKIHRGALTSNDIARLAKP